MAVSAISRIVVGCSIDELLHLIPATLTRWQLPTTHLIHVLEDKVWIFMATNSAEMFLSIDPWRWDICTVIRVFFFTVQRAIFGRTEPSRVYSLVCGVHSGCDSALSQSPIQVLPTTYCSSLILVLYTAISQNQRTRGPCWKAFPRWSNTRASYPVTRLEEWDLHVNRIVCFDDSNCRVYVTCPVAHENVLAWIHH